MGKKPGVIICSRTNSERVPNKPLKKINGKTILEHLITRVSKSGLHIYLAVPLDQLPEYEFLKLKFNPEKFTLVGGVADDPLARMYHCALSCRIDPVVRVCHDKIFVDDTSLINAMGTYHRHDLDYLYSSTFTEGSGFEIMSFDALTEAAEQFKRVEHVSYAIKSVTDNHMDYTARENLQSDYRLLIDYPEDVTLMETLLSELGNDCTLLQVLDYMDRNLWAEKLNRLPKVTVYTCAYNAEKYLEKCMGSVSKQNGFKDYEYIIVDDFSDDSTYRLANKFSTIYKNVRVVRNDENVGLASASNVALKQAKAPYIVRLDADDYFPNLNAVSDLLKAIVGSGKDVIYPNNYFGAYNKIQRGKTSHHIGGAIFDRRAINHIKFTDRLRGLEGYDFFKRAKSQLAIGYLNKPIFFYRQTKESMSKTNLEERKKIKAEIDAKI